MFLSGLPDGVIVFESVDHSFLKTRTPARAAGSAFSVGTFARDTAKWVIGLVARGLHRLRGPRTVGTCGIAVYHRLSPVVSGLPRPTMNVTPERFRAQLIGLRKRGYQVLSLGALLDLHTQGQPAPPKSCVLTFDDGFGSIHEHAWPILREMNMPATVFVNTAYLDADRPFPFDAWGREHEFTAPPSAWRPLMTSECEEMLAGGLIEIGSHTHTHADFRNQPATLVTDLALSTRALRDRLGLADATFAFPYGRVKWGFVSPELIDVVRAAGLRCALSTEAVPVDPTSSPFTWGRFNAYQWDSAATLAAKFNGWYSWGPALQERWLRKRLPATAQGKEAAACPK